MEIEELIDNFSFLDSWEDKYRYIIELGEKLPPLPPNLKTEDWKVKGCQSQVWLVPLKKGDNLQFLGDSDAMIVKGLISIVLLIYNNKSPSAIKAVAVDDIFAKLGLKDHLSPSRRNGLEAMVAKIRQYADIL